MSATAIRSALQVALSGMSPALSTAWENVSFTPQNGVPYQKAFLLFAKPDNSEYGANYREQGIFHINLMYPISAGTTAPESRAEMIRQAFKRGSSFSSDGVDVVVDKTPELSGGVRDGDRWALSVKIQWHAQVST